MSTVFMKSNDSEGSRRRTSVVALAVVVLLMLCVSRAQAQTNNNHLMLSAGLLYERGVDATLAYEHSTRYHNAWEFFGNYYIKYEDDPDAGHITKDSFWNSYNTWLLGICYKPCVGRGRNHHGNIRLGGSCGSDNSNFIGAVNIGYEHTYALYGGWELFFQLREDVVFGARDLFRTGVSLGVKVPLSGNK